MTAFIIAFIMIIAAIFGEKLLNQNAISKYENFQTFESAKQNQEIYSEFWELINKNYYDANFDGIDWNSQFEIGMKAAQLAKNRVETYNEIIIPQIRKFPVSHLEIIPRFEKIHQNPSSPIGLFEKIFDPIGGLEIIDIKRGTKKYTIVKNIAPNSPANEAGIKTGWLIKNYNLKSGINPNYIIFNADFIPIIIEDFENNDEIDAIINSVNPISKTFIANIPQPKNPFIINDIGGIKYIKFSDFMNSQITDKIINEINKCPQNGIIFDLRDNFGGDLMQLQKVLTPLLPPHSLIMHTKSRSYKRTFHTNFFVKQCKAKIAILIGPSSISAAEIMAQTLQYYKRAVLIGRKTNGSIIGARDFQLSDGSILQIPVLALLGPDLKSYEGKGINPDIKILNSYDVENDLELKTAIENLQKQ